MENEFVTYVSYLEDGTLDGYYIQAPAPDHLDRMFRLDGMNIGPFEWVNYRMNEARDGLEMIASAEPAFDDSEQ